MLKAIRVHVYHNPALRKCSNGGISEKFDELLLVCDGGYIDVDENCPPPNLVKIVTRNLFPEEYKHIEPYESAKGAGWMAGGSWAFSCDARFPSNYALSIHDRDETWEEYEVLSR